jgi:hypothetical protein
MALMTIGEDITVETVQPLCRSLDGNVAVEAYGRVEHCADCHDAGSGSDYWKELHGTRPRHLDTAELAAWYRAQAAAGFPQRVVWEY